MPTLRTSDNANIYYEEYGTGFPLVLFAPGGMRSAIDFWHTSEWDPIKSLSPYYRVIAMDQRNAGRSTAPVHGSHGWHTYTSDHIALLDHLDIEKTHILGGCIGGPYCMGLLAEAPERISSAILQQSIGVDKNKALFYEMFDSWSNSIKKSHPEATNDDWSAFRSNMFDGKFLYNVDEAFVRELEKPLLVLMGNDPYHPEAISRAIAQLATNATLIESWKDPSHDDTINQVQEFLMRHTP